MTTHIGPLFCDTTLARRIEQAEVDLIGAANSAARRREAPGFLISGRRRRRELRRPRIAVQQGDRPGLRRRPRRRRARLESSAHSPPMARRRRSSLPTSLIPRSAPCSPPAGTGSSRSRTSWAVHSTEPRRLATARRRHPSQPGRRVRHLARCHGGRRSPAGHRGSPLARGVPARDLRGGDARRCGGWGAALAAVRAGAPRRRSRSSVWSTGSHSSPALPPSPAHRRHGIQNALLAVRLADAAAEGCDLAVIVTQPGSKSHQNAQRCGFHLLYTRAVLGQVTRGLTGSPSRGRHDARVLDQSPRAGSGPSATTVGHRQRLRQST